jgi:MFS transporter, DHA2 family, multidrug resistance protein
MSALPQEQAGTGSAVNDTVREVGGALGVAVVGSIVSATYRAQLHLAGLPAAAIRAARSSVAAADQVAATAGAHGNVVATAAHRAFTSSMSGGLQVAAILAIAGAVIAGLALPSLRKAAPAQLEEANLTTAELVAA